jgi:YidC/Oxa1 family membrane protein insertase
MLDVVYYPVSAILWFWHVIFGGLLDPAGGVAWALSVAFLVFTLRAVLYPPFVRQARSQRAMQRLQPQILALKKKHAGDREALASALQQLQRENGVNPLSSCLPALIQAPVFLGLFHVLNSFNRTGFPLWMSEQDNANTPNYLFGISDVQSFLDAKLFGAPLAASISSSPAQLAAYGFDVTRLDVALVAVPLMLIAGVATHFTARAAMARQSMVTGGAMGATAGQSALISRLMPWVLPLGVLIGGPFLPVAIGIYWLSNNAWTLAQQHAVNRRLDREEESSRRQPG